LPFEKLLPESTTGPEDVVSPSDYGPTLAKVSKRRAFSGAVDDVASDLVDAGRDTVDTILDKLGIQTYQMSPRFHEDHRE